MDIKQRVGLRIKVLRQNRSLSQFELGESIERTVHTISSIERGISLPNFETLERLAQSFGVPVKEFFDLESDDISSKRAALLTDINDMLRHMSDEDLEVSQGLIKTIAKR